MKKFIFILPFLLMLGACNSTPQVLTTQQLKVVQPPDTLYVCPTVKTFPNPNKLTDVQVARLIVQLYSNNMKCKNSLDSIKSFLQQAGEETN